MNELHRIPEGMHIAGWMHLYRKISGGSSYEQPSLGESYHHPDPEPGYEWKKAEPFYMRNVEHSE